MHSIIGEVGGLWQPGEIALVLVAVADLRTRVVFS